MLVAGLMSGTSADGIDVAVVRITGLGWKTRIRVLAFDSVPYPPRVRRRVREIAGGAGASASEIAQMNFLLGELFARAFHTICCRAGVPSERVALIGSHGQTIYHQNHASNYCGTALRCTLQIGEPAVIAERTGVTTVGDFRPADIAAGGQGAPLVLFFDYLFYRHPRHGRVVLNIGGIANLTAIPAGGAPNDVVAFDTGPGNMLLDELARTRSESRLRYDPAGKLARRGRISDSLVQQMMRLAYFRQPPPKTAGREQFGHAFLQTHFAGFGSSPEGFQNALATATALTAASIARAIADFVLPKFSVEECVVSGGGVKNLFLIEELQKRLEAQRRSRKRKSPIEIVSSDAMGIPADGKEAIAFAVLAYHTYHRQPANLCAATGARHPAILGKVVYASR